MIKVRKNCEVASSWSKTNHLGKNPKNGGNPPKDSKFRKKIAWALKDNLAEVNCLSLLTLNCLLIMVTGKRRIMYNK